MNDTAAESAANTAPILHDSTRCSDCGLCLDLRGGYCLEKEGAGIRVVGELCNRCGECVARCPVGAFSFAGNSPKKLDQAARMQPSVLGEILMGRKSTRSFASRPVDKETLLRCVAAARYAPTMNPDIRATVVDDPALLHELDRRLAAFYRSMYRLLFKNPLMLGFISLFAAGMKSTRRKLEKSLEYGTILYDAPALILLSGQRRVPMTELSAQFQLYSIMLYAETSGLASCLMDSVKIGMNASRGLRELLGLPRGHRVMGALHLGRPLYKAIWKTPGLSIDVRFAEPLDRRTSRHARPSREQ